MRLFAALLLASCATAAPAYAQTCSALCESSYRTSGDAGYYVDADGGSDSNACTGGAGGACATIQGALNKIPKLLQHGVTVNVATGNYSCFYVSGFTCDPSVQQTTGGLLIDGVLITDTIVSGSATGTASSGTQGVSETFGTLADTTETWTANDLTGRLLQITSGTGAGQVRPISTNTATVATIVGSWSTSPDATSNYAIVRPGPTVNTACPIPATPLAASGANNAAVQLTGNNCGYRSTGAIVMRNIGISVSTGHGVHVGGDFGEYLFAQMKVSATGAGKHGFTNTSTPTGTSLVQVNQSTFTGSTTGRAVDSNTAARWILNNVLSYGPNYGLAGTIASGQTTSQLTVNSSEAQNSTTAGFIVASASGSLIGNSRLNCANSAGIAIALGASFTTQTLSIPYTPAFAMVNHVSFGTTCGIGILVQGPSAVVTASSCSGGPLATTGYALNWGGSLLAQNSAMPSGATNDISLDNGSSTAVLADVATGSCFRTLGYGSSFCK